MPAPAATNPATGPAAPERWFVLAHNGKQYGPLPRAELDAWYLQQRLTPQTQLLREGDAAWIWARELFPALVQSQPTQPVGLSVPPYRPAPSAKKRPRKSEVVSLVALFNGIVCGLLLISAVGVIVGGTRVDAINQQQMQRRARSPNTVPTYQPPIATVFALIYACIPFIASIPFGLAGYGIMDRRQWGRILGFITAGFMIIPAFVALAIFCLMLFVLLSVSDNARGTDVALWTTLGALAITLLSFGFAIYSFYFLSKQPYGSEFR